NFKTEIHGVTTVGQEPIVIKADAQLAIFRIGLPIGVQAPLRRLIAERSIEFDYRERDGARNRWKAHSKERVQFVVDLAHPAEAGSHYQVIGDDVRVGQEKPGAKPRLAFQAGQFVVDVDAAVAAGEKIVAVSPVAPVELLSVREVVVDREPPI